jgi:hypothetical protein
MRNTSVNVDGVTMQRTYKGVVEKSDLADMSKLLEEAVSKFTKKRKSR